MFLAILILSSFLVSIAENVFFREATRSYPANSSVTFFRLVNVLLLLDIFLYFAAQPLFFI